jgi:hypothetical protein
VRTLPLLGTPPETKVSASPAEDYFENNEGNNGQNKLFRMGVHIDGWFTK